MTVAHDSRVVVVGQGYVGLPLADARGRGGLRRRRASTSTRTRVDRLRRADSFIDDITDDDLARRPGHRPLPAHRPTRRTSPGSTIAVVSRPDAAARRRTDLSFIEDAARAARAARPAAARCVVLESTTYPGTTEEVVRAAPGAGSAACAPAWTSTSATARSGSTRATDLGPRRTRRRSCQAWTTPSRTAVAAFYDTLVDRTVPVPATGRPSWRSCWRTPSGTSTSRWSTSWRCTATTSASTSGRSIDAGGDQAVRLHAVHAGPGVGGHCLPIDPSLPVVAGAPGSRPHLPVRRDRQRRQRPHARLRRHARRRAPQPPPPGGQRQPVLLLGLAYKRNSGDARQSPATEVARRLLDLGAEVRAVDPRIAVDESPRPVELVACTPTGRADADLVVVLTDHDEIDWELLEQNADRVLDTRNRLTGTGVDRL